MTPLSGQHTGIAILRVESDQRVADRVLIRVRAVDDVTDTNIGEELAFSDASQAIEFLRRWLEQWPARTW